MKTVGIICEYNPFHLGHARQFQLIRESLGDDTRIVCVMSGNYVQRGMPAMWDKSTRAESALRCGADLVLELPITGVLCSAEGFARTGVKILTDLGSVDYLCFGAECGNADQLMDLAKRIDSPAVIQELKHHLSCGLSYAAARQAALQDPLNLLVHPNNTLGMEYCRAILQLNSHLIPLSVLRVGDYHAETADSSEPSATAVRALFPNGNWQAYLPKHAVSVFQDAPWYDVSFGERALLARLRALSDKQWQHCAHGSEGLWRKAMKAARTECSYLNIAASVKSKRYPMTRIHRLLLCAYLGISEEDLMLPIPYVRILAASTSGREILRQAKKAGNLQLINPGQVPTDLDYYRLECRCSDLYTLFASPSCQTNCQTEQNRRIVFSD